MAMAFDSKQEISAGQLGNPPALKARRLGLHAQHQAIVVMRTDCHVCRSEGLAQRSQVAVRAAGREIQALLYQVDDWLEPDTVALSEEAWARLGVGEGDTVEVTHPRVLESLSSVRRRIYGHRLDDDAMLSVVRDVADGRYSDVQLAAFLTAGAALPLDERETVALTRAMVAVGERLSWDAPIVLDKHCIGGLPGNRTTPIVVAIVAAHGLIMPKTSSRAITSPAGTADAMETIAPVALSMEDMRRVVGETGACIAWGGAVHLSPADDVFVRVERELDIDTEGQLIASVLSKKVAAGATHVVIDIPVGPTAKVRSAEAGEHLAQRLISVGAETGLVVTCLQTDGDQPVGRGIGPALEARDVLSVLQDEPQAPEDLRQRSARLAGAALEIGGAAPAGQGLAVALETLADGRAWRKFQQIVQAQGGMRVLPLARHQHPLGALRAGRVVHIDNRRLARLAKLAGAPESQAAGLVLHVRLGDEVARHQPLLTVHADSPGELAYALEYWGGETDIIKVV